MTVFSKFYNGSENLEGVNSSWLCLIPKKCNVNYASDYRPISLVHSLAKIISKVLANRLQSFMDQLINPFQAAFTRGRHILDNFYAAHILIHDLHTTKQQAALLKLDFERAFDNINWKFLTNLLQARGFDNRWTGWITSLQQSATTAVLLNGVPGKNFTCKRGLRQGDPLSPLLFNLCVDVLFQMLQMAINSNSLPGVGTSDCKIHTLQFADDMLLFFDGTTRSAAVIKLILDAFSDNSGLKINFGKSSIIPINLPDNQTSTLAVFFGCTSQEFPISYLGLPLSPKALNKGDFLPLVERIDNRLAGWKGLLLSKGGRLVLINSVLTSIPTYFCSAFRLPIWVTKAIDKIRRGFFWRGAKAASGFHCLVKWENVCLPKSLGGLGIRNLRNMNDALLMKGLWKFYNFTTLPWVRLLMHKHYKRRPCLLDSSKPPGCSPIWKAILSTAAPFSTSVNFSIGNGKAVSMWNSRWYGERSMQKQFPNLHASSTTKHISVASWFRRFATHPMMGFSAPLNFEQDSEFLPLRTILSDITLHVDVKDSIIWRWTATGCFSAGSAYAFLAFGGVKDGRLPQLWKIKIPLRVKIFMWLAARNRLLTADLLIKRGWHGPSICVLCSANDENLDHLLFGCTFSRSVWALVLASAGASASIVINEAGDIPTRWNRHRYTLSGSIRTLFDACFTATCWALWKERNSRIFRNRRITKDELGKCIRAEVELWRSSWAE